MTIQVARLKKLANYLFNLKLKENTFFDMYDFGYKDECGTKLCMCGWATKIPSFKKLGLKLYNTSNNRLNLHFKKDGGFKAVSTFFGISIDDAACLFGRQNNGITSPREGAVFIMNWLENERLL